MPKPTRCGYSKDTIHQPWTWNIALLRHLYELARFLSAADKTPLQRLSYMSCRVLRGGFQPTPTRLARRSRRASAVRKRRCKITKII